MTLLPAHRIGDYAATVAGNEPGQTDEWRRAVRRSKGHNGARGACVPFLVMLVVPAAAGAAAPAALPPGVHIDPNGPSAKEYAIPLDQARRGGDGGASSPGRLFGAGIRTAGGTAGGSPPPATRSPIAGRPSRARPGQPPPTAPPSALSADQLLGPSQGAGTGIAWMLGVAAVVLALGAAAAALARRSRRIGHPPPP
jgi:hypothetical protein